MIPDSTHHHHSCDRERQELAERTASAIANPFKKDLHDITNSLPERHKAIFFAAGNHLYYERWVTVQLRAVV